MTERIFKYIVPLRREVFVQMHKGARILSVQTQGESIAVWARVQDDAPLVGVDFRVFATGEELPPNPGHYVGTVQLGWTVWHVFVLTTSVLDTNTNPV